MAYETSHFIRYTPWPIRMTDEGMSITDQLARLRAITYAQVQWGRNMQGDVWVEKWGRNKLGLGVDEEWGWKVRPGFRV